MVTTSKHQQTIVFKVKMMDHMKIKDGGSQKDANQADPHGFSMRITAKCGILPEIYQKWLPWQQFLSEDTQNLISSSFDD